MLSKKRAAKLELNFLSTKQKTIPLQLRNSRKHYQQNVQTILFLTANLPYFPIDPNAVYHC